MNASIEKKRKQLLEIYRQLPEPDRSFLEWTSMIYKPTTVKYLYDISHLVHDRFPEKKFHLEEEVKKIVTRLQKKGLLNKKLQCIPEIVDDILILFLKKKDSDNGMGKDRLHQILSKERRRRKRSGR